MTVPETDNGNFLGGLHGGHWNPYSQAQSSAAQQAGFANFGAAYQALAYPYTPARPAIKDAGIRAGEIIAYRVWVYRGGLLRSMTADYVWMPFEIATGDPGSGLGIHAFKSMGDAVGQYGHPSYGKLVFGTVALWGDVIEHEKGYRAEFAEIESVSVLYPGDELPKSWRFWRKPKNTLAKIRHVYGLQKSAPAADCPG